MRRWYEISEELETSIIERHEKGESFSKIGRDVGLDRRAVAKVIRRFEERKFSPAIIRRDEIAQLFHTHLDNMKSAALALLELTASPKLRGSLFPSEPDIMSAVASRLASEFRTQYVRLPDLTEAEETQLELRERVQLRLATRRAEAAITSLQEHIPGLRDKIGKWQEMAAKYRENWECLKEEAIGKDIPGELFEPAVKLALETIGVEVENLPYSGEQEAPTDRLESYKTILLQGLTTRQAVVALSENLTELNIIWKKLEEMVSSPQLDKALLNGHCRYCPVP